MENELNRKIGVGEVSGDCGWAPAIANFYIPSKAGYTRMGSVLLDGAISLNDLRAAIADHERTDYVSDIRNHIAPTTRVVKCQHIN